MSSRAKNPLGTCGSCIAHACKWSWHRQTLLRCMGPLSLELRSHAGECAISYVLTRRAFIASEAAAAARVAASLCAMAASFADRFAS